MRTVWALLSLVVLYAGVASAAPQKKALVDEVSGQGYGMAGCGLGSIIFGAKPGMVQIVAATFNSTFGSQTFGTTSGTPDCVSDDDSKRAELFVESNRLALEDDISRGQGETLANFAEIIGCGKHVKLGTELQKNFERIFPSRTTSSKAVTETIYQTIGNNSELAVACFQVG